MLGCVSFWICHFHSSSSSAMCSHLLSRPSRMGLCVVDVTPMDGDVLVIDSVMMVGRSVRRLCARAFLLVVRTPNFGRGLLIHAVISSVGGWRFGPRAIFPGCHLSCGDCDVCVGDVEEDSPYPFVFDVVILCFLYADFQYSPDASVPEGVELIDVGGVVPRFRSPIVVG